MVVPLRSLLFMPGNNARAHEKAATLAVDAIIFDLEDAVAPTDKAAAREQIALSLASHDYGYRQLFVRINQHTSTTARDELALLAQHPEIAGVLLPKVENAEAIQTVAAWMDELGCARSQRILANIETPLGILNAAAIAQAHPRLAAFIAGKNDLTAAMRLPEGEGRAGLHFALSQMLLAARAYGLMAFDGVFNDTQDAMGFAGECAEGRVLGFDGKTLIHPSQIEIANVAFSPTDEQVEHARTVVASWETQNKGVATAGTQMIEELHVVSARRILAMHQAIAQLS